MFESIKRETGETYLRKYVDEYNREAGLTGNKIIGIKYFKEDGTVVEDLGTDLGDTKDFVRAELTYDNRESTVIDNHSLAAKNAGYSKTTEKDSEGRVVSETVRTAIASADPSGVVTTQAKRYDPETGTVVGATTISHRQSAGETVEAVRNTNPADGDAQGLVRTTSQANGNKTVERETSDGTLFRRELSTKTAEGDKIETIENFRRDDGAPIDATTTTTQVDGTKTIEHRNKDNKIDKVETLETDPEGVTTSVLRTYDRNGQLKNTEVKITEFSKNPVVNTFWNLAFPIFNALSNALNFAGAFLTRRDPLILDLANERR